MILRSRRKNESLFARIFRRKQNSHDAIGEVCSSSQFLRELAKEACRSNRRTTHREFAVISITFIDSPFDALNRVDLVAEFARRLRISDVLGWYNDNLAVLLPETHREGARVVANTLAKVSFLRDLKVDTEIKVYPWDDELASEANELLDESDRSTAMPLDEEPPESIPEANLTELSDRDALNRFSRIGKGASQIPFDAVLPTPFWKRSVDIVGSTLGLILLSPFFLMAAIAIKLNSKGPVFFKQMREGKDGAVFGIWKFRTMCVEAEELKHSLRSQSEQDGPAFKLENDPRITSVGRYLRKTCVDELPQLINVLRGEMSLVGPRPLPVSESHACELWQRHRLRALPGLTCIWQVEGGRETKFSDWMRMDMQYIQQRSFWFDMKLIVKTVLVVLLHRRSV